MEPLAYHRKCKMCGKDLPEGSNFNRQYCDECKILAHYERNRERRKRMAEAKKFGLNVVKTAPSPEDVKYCEPCIYKETHSSAYLCNYYLITGARRGCPYGTRCTKRQLKNTKNTH